ncbi:hypothetical protein [Hymenobacter siberiensis]|jgi:hypothetical protein|uniref:hypothetical protein n=1 Tax=Hymenobacter siberiensis TaxID=2848396 RepID=UPI001C1E34D7|nr:hypothetical protein [Hymenobacter siberiensis]MBU6123075.1 hypothetical protein [Hymenobacter siberiensis]
MERILTAINIDFAVIKSAAFALHLLSIKNAPAIIEPINSRNEPVEAIITLGLRESEKFSI